MPNKKFKENIQIDNGRYHVKLAWNEDIIKKVKPNLEVAKVLAKKVHNNNCKADVEKDYLAVFEELLKLGIIEKITSSNPKDHVWVPHRPVIREDPLVKTSKVRPVFTCSLKSGNAPSLNEAAFPGIDLMKPLLGLVQMFKTNY